jgi:ferritin-like protein
VPAQRHGWRPVQRAKDPADVKAIPKVLVDAERRAVRSGTHVCDLTAGKDHHTYALSLAILNEEIGIEAWFSEFLGEGASGHFMRQGETSPFGRPFMA